ncbi:MAG: right-handed parallel beta-helix repeat-containing protein [Bacteroidota bacterium]
MRNIILTFIIFSLLNFACGSVKDSGNLLSTDKLPATLNNLASGSSVKLATATYTLDQVIMLNGKQNITIDGNGSTLIMNSLSENVIHLTGCTNIRLLNFKATHIEPRGPTGCTGNVLYMDDSSEVLVQGCDLNGSGIVGIAAYNVDNLQVKDNYIHENSEYSIIYQGPSILLTDNTFENNGNGNVIYYSYVPKNGASGWPPEQQIGLDTQREGLVMRDNVFK